MYRAIREPDNPDLYENPGKILESYRPFAAELLGKYAPINEVLGFGSLDFSVDFTKHTGETASVRKITRLDGEVTYSLLYSNAARHTREIAERRRQSSGGMPEPYLSLVTPLIEAGAILEPTTPSWQPDFILRQDCAEVAFIHSELAYRAGWQAAGKIMLGGYPISIEYGAK